MWNTFWSITRVISFFTFLFFFSMFIYGLTKTDTLGVYFMMSIVFGVFFWSITKDIYNESINKNKKGQKE